MNIGNILKHYEINYLKVFYFTIDSRELSLVIFSSFLDIFIERDTPYPPDCGVNLLYIYTWDFHTDTHIHFHTHTQTPP